MLLKCFRWPETFCIWGGLRLTTKGFQSKNVDVPVVGKTRWRYLKGNDFSWSYLVTPLVIFNSYWLDKNGLTQDLVSNGLKWSREPLYLKHRAKTFLSSQYIFHYTLIALLNYQPGTKSSTVLDVLWSVPFLNEQCKTNPQFTIKKRHAYHYSISSSCNLRLLLTCFPFCYIHI